MTANTSGLRTELHAIAKEAYIFAYPMLENYKQSTQTECRGRSRSKWINSFIARVRVKTNSDENQEFETVEDVFTRMWENLIGRGSGPLSFRLILQPLMAATFGILDGLKDARKGCPAYFWALFTEPVHRRALLRNGWELIAKIFLLAIVLDAIYLPSVLPR